MLLATTAPSPPEAIVDTLTAIRYSLTQGNRLVSNRHIMYMDDERPRRAPGKLSLEAVAAEQPYSGPVIGTSKQRSKD